MRPSLAAPSRAAVGATPRSNTRLSAFSAAPRSAQRARRGFTYLAVLGLVAATTAATAMLAPVWHTAAQRERERELLAVGAEFRAAIASYVAAHPAQRREYPRSLDDLVLDRRHPGIRRHLRRIHVDPVTGRAEWGLVRAADGGIAGVHSLSTARPFKQQGFGPGEARFNGATRHADWLFLHLETGLAVASPARAASAPGR